MDIYTSIYYASTLNVCKLSYSNIYNVILPPFPKDLPSFHLRVFPKDLPSFALFLIWQNKFPYLPSHVTINLSYGPPLHY